MMAWRLAKGLEQLRQQVNIKWPKRSKASDGTIGDQAHSARTSDHNPVREIVHALDLTHDPANGFDSWKFADMILRRQDPRLKYVISNGRIGSGPAGPQPGVWRKYTGSNSHAHHVHFSITDAGEDDVRAWAFDNIEVKPVPTAPKELARQLHFGLEGADVEELQRKLGLPVNGFFGYGTAEAVVKVQQKAGIAAHGVVGPGTWKAIGQGS